MRSYKCHMYPAFTVSSFAMDSKSANPELFDRCETSPQEYAEYFWPILSGILACRGRLTPNNSEQLFRAAAVTFE
jgi:hypothetical protein